MKKNNMFIWRKSYAKLTKLLIHRARQMGDRSAKDSERRKEVGRGTRCPQWLTCDFAPIRSLACSVSLAEIKANARHAEIGLVRQSQLAVMPLTAQEFDIIVNEMANKSME
jgi:predicted RNA-binding protein with PUA-like domain